MKYGVLNISLILTIVLACNTVDTAKKKLSITDDAGTLTIENYYVKFGNTDASLIEEGLLLILKELKDASAEQKDLKGTVDYTFRCEADGFVRWLAAGKSDLSVDDQDALKNEFSGYLMKKQLRFPNLEEMTMIEVHMKFE